jgi:hypothetical protein
MDPYGLQTKPARLGPADVVRDLMRIAIRFAVAGPAYGPAAVHVEDAARALLDSSARALRPIVPGEDERRSGRHDRGRPARR